MDEDETNAAERLPAPSEHVQKLMAEHLEGDGMIEPFDLERHVHLGEPRLPSQVLSWNPANATFLCGRCGQLVSTGEITSEMIWRARVFDPALKPHLAGLYDPAERDEMARRYLSGELGREQLNRLRERSYRRDAAGRRPAVEGRRRRLQAWMLERYAELGVVELVLDAAEEFQQTDAALWDELVGRPLVRSTIRKDYWNPIDPALKTEAFARFESRED